MIVPGLLAQRFAIHETYVTAVSRRVRDNLRKYADDEGLPFVGRVKGVESLTEKLEGGRYARWRDIDDLYACALVMPTLQSEPAVIQFLEEKYEPVAIRRRGHTLKDPTVFRFDATRYIGRLRADEKLPEDSPLRSVSFEIQLRTAFEHAWSAATHQLSYKTNRIDWRRLRIAAQLKATVEQLDQLLLGFESAADTVAEHRWPELEAQKAIEAFFRTRFEIGSLPTELSPVSWSRFCNNLYSLLLATSGSFVRDKEAFVAAKLVQLDAGLTALGVKNIPLSLTITQLSLGLLADAGAITGKLERLTPLLTDDLFTMFPAAKQLAPGFDFEDPSPNLAA